MFEVIPAIDVSNGRLAAFSSAGPRPIDGFGGDPIAAADAAIAAGARWLHVVDMDLAFQGEARNLGVVRSIADRGTPIQAAGGIRSGAEVRALLDAGASRVVLGSAALGDAVATRDVLADHGSRLVLGIEVDQGRIRSRGRDPVDLDLMQTLGWLVPAGASAFLVTAVARVGGSAGPDVGVTRRVVRAGRPVLSGGGISTIEDLRALRAAGAVGAVVGRAVVDGTLDLAAAIAELA